MNRIRTIEQFMAASSFVMGVPSFLVLFFQGQVVLGIVVVLLLISVAVIVWLKVEQESPNLSILDLDKLLVIEDVNGHTATLQVKVKVRANRAGIDSFSFSGIAADGRIDSENIMIDGVKIKKPEKLPGDVYKATKNFAPMTQGAQKTIVLEFKVNDAFTSSKEELIHGVIRPTKRLTMVVQLPYERPVRHASAYIGFGGEIQEGINERKILKANGGQTLSLEVTAPEVGREYYLSWEW